MKKGDKEYNKTSQTKYITRETRYTSEDGEQRILETEVHKMYYGEAHFWKIFLNDFLQAMGLISNSKQIDVILYMMKNIRQDDNLFIGTYQSISEKTGISYPTIARTFKKMLEHDFLIRLHSGAYRINAKIMMKGKPPKRRRLIINYEEEKRLIEKKEDNECINNPNPNPPSPPDESSPVPPITERTTST